MAHLATRPTNLRDASEALRGKRERRIGNNTWLHRLEDGNVAMLLHDTDIVIWTADGISLDSGGWKTPTTKDRMTSILQRVGFTIWQTRGEWALVRLSDRKTWPYADGMTVYYDPDIAPTGAATLTARDQDKATRKMIAAYAKHCADHLQDIGTPSNADCLYCFMQPLDDMTGDAEHLRSHIEESYYVPSLIITALRQNGATDLIWSTTWAIMDGAGTGRWPEDIAREQVKRSVKKYLTRRLGLAG